MMRRERGHLACFRKPRKRTASRVTALVLHGVVKPMDEGTKGNVETALKAWGAFKSALSFARGDNRGSPRRTTGGTAISCVFVPIYIKETLHKRRDALMRVSRGCCVRCSGLEL